MNEEHDELVEKMAGRLQEWADDLAAEGEERDTIDSDLVGERMKQYDVLGDLYELITASGHFPVGAKRKGMRFKAPLMKLKRVREMIRLVSLAFKHAYDDKARTKRQQAHVWGSVLSNAWHQNIDTSDFEMFLFRGGGIHKVYKSLKKRRLQSQP